MNPLLLLGSLGLGLFMLARASDKPKPVGEYATQWSKLDPGTQQILSELMMTQPTGFNAWEQRMSQTKAWAAKLRNEGYPAVAQTLEQRVSSLHRAATQRG